MHLSESITKAKSFSTNELNSVNQKQTYNMLRGLIFSFNKTFITNICELVGTAGSRDLFLKFASIEDFKEENTQKKNNKKGSPHVPNTPN